MGALVPQLASLTVLTLALAGLLYTLLLSTVVNAASQFSCKRVLSCISEIRWDTPHFTT